MRVPVVGRSGAPAKALGSNAVVADSTQTMLCTYLSAVLLVGLVLNATLGWHWADPIAGLVIAAVAAKEGADAWRGERCCARRRAATPDAAGPTAAAAASDAPAVPGRVAADDRPSQLRRDGGS